MSRREASFSIPRELCVDLREFVDESLGHAEQALARQPDTLHEGIHQSRKSLRKCRAALGLTGVSLDPTARFDGTVNALCKSLSGLRDGQAVLDSLARFASLHPRGHVTEQVIPYAMAYRDRSLRESLQTDPAFTRTRFAVRALKEELRALDWNQATAFDATRGISRSEIRVLKAYQHARSNPSDPEAWHALRRRLRRLKNQSVLLTGSSPLLSSVRFDEAFQQRLSDAQDESVLLTLCGAESWCPAPIRHALEEYLRARLDDMYFELTSIAAR